MKTPEERAIYDDFELPEHYDFTGGIRGRFYQPKKIPTSMRLDDDILIILKKEASEKKIAYQTLINSLLRKHVQSFKLEK
ncbi:MAG: hypothetical protein HAW58_04050 [Candidatus Thioglobus sp.]|nr:hypothetical protein [Candidatus Thioglobus sp.]